MLQWQWYSPIELHIYNTYAYSMLAVECNLFIYIFGYFFIAEIVFSNLQYYMIKYFVFLTFGRF